GHREQYGHLGIWGKIQGGGRTKGIFGLYQPGYRLLIPFIMQLYKDHQLRVLNSLSGKKEIFSPIAEGHIGMYVCGPTVYSNVHLGNCRTFISFDMIFRYFKHLGYKVRYVRNITDAGHLANDADCGEDKIAKKAKLEQIEPMEVVQRYTVDFHNTLQKFN